MSGEKLGNSAENQQNDLWEHKADVGETAETMPKSTFRARGALASEAFVVPNNTTPESESPEADPFSKNEELEKWLPHDYSGYSNEERELLFSGPRPNPDYINDFISDYYGCIDCNDYEPLLLDKYFDEKTVNSKTVAFKESLDHFMLKHMTEWGYASLDWRYLGYVTYIDKLAKKNTLTVNGEEYYPEYSTNVVLRNPLLRQKIYGEKIKQIDVIVQKNEALISDIYEKMRNEEHCSQEELDFLGNYISQKKDTPEELRAEFINYIYNRPNEEVDFEATDHLLNGLLTCFTKAFSLDDRVKSTRCFLADTGLYSGEILEEGNLGNKYANRSICTLNRKNFLQASMNSDKSLNHSHSYKNLDRYSLMQVAFHELTHQYQEYMFEDGNISTTMSGLCGAVHRSLLSAPEITWRDSEGKEHHETEYECNHDAHENEIDADEKAWAECAKFIGRYIYKNPNHEDRIDAYQKMLQCYKNQNLTKTRRAIAYKYGDELSKKRYDEYDIELIGDLLRKQPDSIPDIMADYFDASTGKPKIDLFIKNFSIYNENDDREASEIGVNFLRYLINHNPSKILDFLKSGNLDNDSITNCINNISSVVRKNASYALGIHSASPDTFDGAGIGVLDFAEEKDNFLEHYAIECQKHLDFSRKAYRIIQQRYPDYQHSSFDGKEYIAEYSRFNREASDDCWLLTRRGRPLLGGFFRRMGL